jgi:hypothetical protein
LDELLEEEKNSQYGTKTINADTIAGNEERKSLISAAKTAKSKDDFYSSYSNYTEGTLDDIW